MNYGRYGNRAWLNLTIAYKAVSLTFWLSCVVYILISFRVLLPLFSLFAGMLASVSLANNMRRPGRFFLSLGTGVGFRRGGELPITGLEEDLRGPVSSDGNRSSSVWP